jgi:hypothetical protein
MRYGGLSGVRPRVSDDLKRLTNQQQLPSILGPDDSGPIFHEPSGGHEILPVSRRDVEGFDPDFRQPFPHGRGDELWPTVRTDVIRRTMTSK